MNKLNDFGKLPLSAPQLGLWFAQELIGKVAANNIAELITINGLVDEGKFRDAVRVTILEAESLRVRIEQVGEEIFQRLDPDRDPQVATIDVSGDPDAVTTIKDWVSLDLGRSVNFDAGDPLYTFALFKVSSEKYIWYLRSHHVVCDGYSGMLVARRVAEIYTAVMAGWFPPESHFC